MRLLLYAFEPTLALDANRWFSLHVPYTKYYQIEPSFQAKELFNCEDATLAPKKFTKQHKLCT
jgi:hypothetical protein